MKKIFTILSALLMAAMTLKAQEGEIIYREFDPPLEIVQNVYGPAQVLELDFDGDGMSDHRFYGNSSDGLKSHEWNLLEVSLNGWETRLVYLDENNPYTFDESDTIISNAPNGWNQGPDFVHFYYPNLSDNGIYHETYGMHKVIDGMDYYGWYHGYGTEGSLYSGGPYEYRVYIDKIAFCTIPNYPLRWGQTSITAPVEEVFIYYENPSNDWDTLTVDQQLDFDINGDGDSDIKFVTFEGSSGSSSLGSGLYTMNGWKACCYRTAPLPGYDNIFFDLSLPLNDTSLVWSSICSATQYSTFPISYKVGLRVADGEHYYYGWVECEQERSSWYHAFFHLSKTCFCTIPDYPLRWGQTSLFSNGMTEWYYEIQNDDGSITYQHLEYAADTTIGNERPKIIIRSNTHYDRDEVITETTHEYIYEKNGKIYWWNKELEEFTVLYDLVAESGDEWEIKVGTESLIMHVDSVEYIDYDGQSYRTLHVSDAGNLFGGDIVCGIGHQTSFFPERLMRDTEGFSVTGLRCYWVDDELIFHGGDEDCDAIYTELHGIDETNGDTFTVYPNPANSVLFVETRHGTSLSATYRITNLMGQTLLQGSIHGETLQIDIANLPAGVYFVNVMDEEGRKCVRKVVKE